MNLELYKQLYYKTRQLVKQQKYYLFTWMWGYMAVDPTLERLKQEDHESQVSRQVGQHSETTYPKDQYYLFVINYIVSQYGRDDIKTSVSGMVCFGACQRLHGSGSELMA